MFELKFTELAKRLHKEQNLDFTPIRGTELSAGYDLKACIEEPIWIYPNQVELTSTGVHIYIGSERKHNMTTFVGCVVPRSSSNGLVLENTIGIIDADYQGELFCKLKNTTDEPIMVKPGQKIAQYLLLTCWIPNLIEVESFSSVTARGFGGNGSTGKF